MREIDSTELHPILLDIAIAFHNVCVKNNIKYWMLGGTQLGAVRHNGFIPWDDDMDFGILSEDWDKLVTALDKDLPSVYKCRTRFNCTKFYGNTLKIEDTRTIINPDGNDLSEKGNIGINIDIFPLVFTDKNICVFSRNWIIARLILIQYWRFADYSNTKFTKYICKIIKTILFWLKKGDITNLVNKLVKNKGQYIVNYWGRWILKEVIHKDIMGEPNLQNFENTQFYGVSDADAYLKSLYRDYMALPPVDKRNLHIHGMFWKNNQ